MNNLKNTENMQKKKPHNRHKYCSRNNPHLFINLFIKNPP